MEEEDMYQGKSSAYEANNPLAVLSYYTVLISNGSQI